MSRWYFIEQFLKRQYLKWLEKVFAREILSPAQIEWSEVKRILVVRQHDLLGDFLLATPALRALRQRFPAAHIGVLVRAYFAGAARHHPEVNEVLVFDKSALSPWLMLWRQLRRKWDLAVVLNTVSHSTTSDWLAYLSGARYILGSAHLPLPGGTRNFFYNLLAPYAARVKHQSERNLDIVRYIGADTSDLSETMRVLESEKNAAAVKLRHLGLQQHGAVIGMHVGAGKLMNRWPITRFSELAQWLGERYAIEIVLFWGPQEEALRRRFCEALPFSPIKFAPTTLREMAAAFTQCHAIVCNDTGVMHVAAAVGTPLVAIFGPTDPQEWKPIGKKFVAVRGKEQKVESADSQQVFEALRELLEEKLQKHAAFNQPAE